MLKIFKDLLNRGKETEDGPAFSPEKELQVATCALLLEMAHADDEFTSEEEHRIESLMKDHFGISPEVFGGIKAVSDQRRTESIDLWHFAKIIKENYSPAEKEKVIEMVWAVVYADGRLDAHEDYLVHQLARILDLEHKQLIDAKVRVLKQAQAHGA